MAAVMKSKEQWLAESDALIEWGERVARDDPDWTIYWPDEPRPPPLPWWRRLLKI